MEVIAATAIAPLSARYMSMISTGPRIDPHRLYTKEELAELLPATLLRLIISKTTSIDGLYSGRQVGDLIEDVFKEASLNPGRSSSRSTPEKEMYLTVAQVAEILNSSSREITRLVDAGKLRALDLNEGRGKKKRALRIRREWIEELEARLITNPEEQPKPKFVFAATRAHQKK
jgi:excisionase family DNA binding protein